MLAPNFKLLVKQLQFVIFIVFGICFINKIKAQPTVLGTDAKVKSFEWFNLNIFGKLRQYRFQADSNAISGSSKWEFLIGTAGAPNYNVNWRPYLSSLTISSLDSIIVPHAASAPAYAAAQYNLASGGSSGFLPAIVANRYYTFNIGDSAGNNYMAVWETNFNPTTIAVNSQSPDTVCTSSDSVNISLRANQLLNSSENVFLRYSSSANFAASSLVQAQFVGLNGYAKIPTPSAVGVIYYYVFTSKYNINKLAPNGVVNQTYCDLSSLTISNNNNNNYSYSIISAPVPNVDFSTTNFCSGSATLFTNNTTISSGSIANYNWTFGDGSPNNNSASTFNKTYISASNYTISLTATSNLGCTKTINKTITINQPPITGQIISVY
jgi:hypothetical protein